MNLFAVQILRGESPRDVVELVLRKAEEQGASCKTLELLDPIEVGSRRYARVRADFARVDDVLESLYSSTRGVILTAHAGGHPIKTAGRTGVIPFGKIQIVPRETIAFRGNALPYWERQFLPSP
jgi:hypothetical protein